MTASQHTIAGTVLTMPVRIRKANQHMAMFSVDADAAQRMIDYSGLRVCRYLPGRAIVVLMLMHYIDGDLGQYYEYGTSVMVNPPGSKASGPRGLQSAGAGNHHLPVDQPLKWWVEAAAVCRARGPPSSTTCPSTSHSRWKREPRSGATRRSWRTSRFEMAASSVSTSTSMGSWWWAWIFGVACLSG
jgi:hypothetical protein